MGTAIEPGASRRTIEREQREFERMMERSKRRAYSMALKLTRDKAEAEDLLQETYLKAWRGFGSYAAGRPFLNWLLRIMQHAYLDSLRRANPVRRAESLNSLVSAVDGEVQELVVVDPSPRPDQQALRNEYAQEVRKALGELTEPYRSTIELCDIEQLSYYEIAKIQNTTVGTVRSRIHRGRKILRDIVLRRAPHLVQ